MCERIRTLPSLVGLPSDERQGPSGHTISSRPSSREGHSFHRSVQHCVLAYAENPRGAEKHGLKTPSHPIAIKKKARPDRGGGSPEGRCTMLHQVEDHLTMPATIERMKPR